MTEHTPLADRLVARLLQMPWLTRLPIPLYRGGLGWIFGGEAIIPMVEFGPPGRTDDAVPARGTPRAGYSR